MRQQPNDGLQPVNDYERTTFFQILKGLSKPVLGVGRTITQDDVANAFFRVNPEYAEEGALAQSMFTTMIWPALRIEIETEGYTIHES